MSDNWTTEEPTAPGYYWVKFPGLGDTEGPRLCLLEHGMWAHVRWIRIDVREKWPEGTVFAPVVPPPASPQEAEAVDVAKVREIHGAIPDVLALCDRLEAAEAALTRVGASVLPCDVDDPNDPPCDHCHGGAGRPHRFSCASHGAYALKLPMTLAP